MLHVVQVLLHYYTQHVRSHKEQPLVDHSQCGQPPDNTIQQLTKPPSGLGLAGVTVQSVGPPLSPLPLPGPRRGNKHSQLPCPGACDHLSLSPPHLLATPTSPQYYIFPNENMFD